MSVTGGKHASLYRLLKDVKDNNPNKHESCKLEVISFISFNFLKGNDPFIREFGERQK